VAGRSGAVVSGAGLLAAFGAGVLSFLSPCVLPVLPGYLAVLAGFDPADPADPARPGRRPQARLLRNAALFCAGFSAVFVALGLTATAAGRLLVRHHALLTRLAGGAVLLMAVYLIGSLLLHRPALYGDHRFHPRPGGAGVLAAPVVGAAFALGWSPCLGPVLGAVLAVAATQGRAAAGAGLLAAYAAGLSVPFLAGTLLYRHPAVLRRVRRAGPAITVLSAVALAGLGLLLVLDRLGWLAAQLQAA
jgi:cytochrome c-type biogenesis protein